MPDEFSAEEAKQERKRLHDFIERLVVWETSNNEFLLAEARYEVAQSVARSRGERASASPDAVLAYLRDYAPPVYDPFAGGGSIPLEAQPSCASPQSILSRSRTFASSRPPSSTTGLRAITAPLKPNAPQ